VEQLERSWWISRKRLTLLTIISCSKNFSSVTGVPHFLIKWFFSYLQHRSQRVRIDTNHSFYSQLDGAIPQGSWLGPLSFLVLINDLRPDCLVHKYVDVDDTTLTEILYDRTKPSTMQPFFHQLLSWAD